MHQGPSAPTSGLGPPKKDPHAPPMTPLEKMLRDSGQVRIDGSDKFFGMENVSTPQITISARTTGLTAIYLQYGNTWYVQ